ncbi:MAG: ABC transporter ATP-binding protein [Actinobacteria bacterium]|nr:MAG: ABC transporter ATP-binding protein [Actinomycetota bacterium]
MSALIELEGVVKQFPGDTEPVLAGISLEVGRGELVALIGPSGCGKSTVLNILAGLIRVTSGTLRINDRDARVSYVFQRPRLLPWRKVRRNVEFSLEQADVTGAARRRAAEAAIERVNLTGHEDKYPHQLSGGMQQRVALARGLAIEPSVLLLDEPFGALDALTRSYMQEELLGIVRGTGTTALLVTHDIDEALLLADRVLVMSSRPGRIKHELRVPFGTERSLDALLQDPEYGRIRSELRHLLRPEVVEELNG